MLNEINEIEGEEIIYIDYNSAFKKSELLYRQLIDDLNISFK